jgi:ATP/maltotriose-dependent transcriptional regulator MalT
MPGADRASTLGRTSIGGAMASTPSPGQARDSTTEPRRRRKARLRDVSLSPGGDTKANEDLALEVGEQLLLAISLGQWDQAEALATQATAVLRRLVTDQESWAAAVPGLSGAELRLLPLLASHLSFPEIGAELFLSVNTIKSQAASIYRKLGVSSRSEAILRVRKLGLLA